MKAILVIDMPANCTECPCFYDYLHCQAKAGVNVLGDERPKECPLKPMPKEEDIYEVGMDEEDTRAKQQWNKGWDACLKEIQR